MSQTIDASDGIDHEHLYMTDRLSAGLHHDAGDHRAGRDLTDFGSRQNFERVLADLDLPTEPIELYDQDGRRRLFAWVNRDLLLITGANPITGERRNPMDSELHSQSEIASEHAHYDKQEVGHSEGAPEASSRSEDGRNANRSGSEVGEVGYASYVGLEGRHDAVEQAMDRIERAMEENPDAFTDGQVKRGSRGFI